jgi:nucleoside-triphosphatase
MLFTPNKNIIILACEKHSGKTTALLQWIKDKENIAGILSPVVNEERMFYNITNGEYFTMLAAANEETLLVGKYAFSKTAFDKANALLQETKNKFVIIDEIGPLELMGKGFADTLKNILQEKSYTNLLLVVRNELVDDMVEYFSIDVNDLQFLTINDLANGKI